MFLFRIIINKERIAINGKKYDSKTSFGKSN